jgi:hypothetical protein
MIDQHLNRKRRSAMPAWSSWFRYAADERFDGDGAGL